MGEKMRQVGRWILAGGIAATGIGYGLKREGEPPVPTEPATETKPGASEIPRTATTAAPAGEIRKENPVPGVESAPDADIDPVLWSVLKSSFPGITVKAEGESEEECVELEKVPLGGFILEKSDNSYAIKQLDAMEYDYDNGTWQDNNTHLEAEVDIMDSGNYRVEMKDRPAPYTNRTISFTVAEIKEDQLAPALREVRECNRLLYFESLAGYDTEIDSVKAQVLQQQIKLINQLLSRHWEFITLDDDLRAYLKKKINDWQQEATKLQQSE